MLGKFAVFDLEWNTETKQIYAFGLVDSNGRKIVLHLEDFNKDEANLLLSILAEIRRYPLTMGFNTTGQDSDFATLDQRCKKLKIPSPVDVYTFRSDNGKEFTLYRLFDRRHIDLYKIFSKPMIKNSIFNNAYRSNKLNDIALALLGRGKTEGVTGKNAQDMSVETQKEYVLNDAQLEYDLTNAYDGEILNLMQTIADIVNLPLERVCNTGITTWIKKVLQDQGLEINQSYRVNFEESYKGGNIFEPEPNYYKNIKVVDVASLYPSVIINYNLSPDTINCSCCHDNKFSKEIINKDYWFCTQNTGKYSGKMTEWRKLRLKYKKEGNEIMSTGLKILINGSYGTFGSPFFAYSDYRVAELTTATGRYIQKKMFELAPLFNFVVIYGDTDSLFFDGNGNIDNFLKECKDKLNVDVEFEKTFSRMIITKKKHYFGLAEKLDKKTGQIKRQVVIKAMEGNKDDRPEWINEVFNQFVLDFCYAPEESLNNIIMETLKNAVIDLYAGKVDTKKLRYSARLTKEVNDYKNDTQHVKIAKMINAKEGDIIYFFKTKKGVSVFDKDIDYDILKEELINVVSDALDILKIDYSEIARYDPCQNYLTHFF